MEAKPLEKPCFSKNIHTDVSSSASRQENTIVFKTSCPTYNTQMLMAIQISGFTSLAKKVDGEGSRQILMP